MLRRISRTTLGLILLLWAGGLGAQSHQTESYPSFDYDAAQTHELKPHRRTIPMAGAQPWLSQLQLTLTVSPQGDVVGADVVANGNSESLKYWPRVQGEVRQWKFTPFEVDGKPVTAQIEEYVDFVPPERLPAVHVKPPVIRPYAPIEITLQRTGCFGACPSYRVTVSTDGIVFEGGDYVVASGRHIDKSVDVDGVRDLARRFVAADFYSMDPSYRADVTDNPTYILSISIDGHKKEVEDYVGSWVGMPSIITELENAVDSFARTDRWIKGSDGLVGALQDESFDFHTFDAQAMLNEASSRGEAATVRQLLQAGVPLTPLPAPKAAEPDAAVTTDDADWLNAASSHPAVLEILIQAGASKDDQTDKDLALAGAANAGDVDAAKALIAYGANPNADLSKLVAGYLGGGIQGQGEGNVLIYAAMSGNPEMIKEILRYHPQLEGRDSAGETALFAAGEYRNKDKDGARVECVRLLVAAGADVNARDNDGNTPLHKTFLTDVEEELLELGADVNARNNDGETPIFTTYDEAAIPLLIKYGADLSIRNNNGETIVEASKDKGPQWQEALRKAMQGSGQP